MEGQFLVFSSPSSSFLQIFFSYISFIEDNIPENSLNIFHERDFKFIHATLASGSFSVSLDFILKFCQQWFLNICALKYFIFSTPIVLCSLLISSSLCHNVLRFLWAISALSWNTKLLEFPFNLIYGSTKVEFCFVAKQNIFV